MMCEIFDGHLLVLSVRTIEPVALSRRPGLPGDQLVRNAPRPPTGGRATLTVLLYTIIYVDWVNPTCTRNQTNAIVQM